MVILPMYIHFELRTGLRYGPGCVVLPDLPRNFGLYCSPSNSLSFVRDDSRLLRLLLALLTGLVLVSGTLHGHTVECIAAVLAAVLVDAVGGFLRGRKEV